jgi:excisionase family DNA binding protein
LWRAEFSSPKAAVWGSFWDIDPLTTVEVARMLGISQSRVRQYILAKRLKAKKFGRDLVVERKEAERFRREGRLPEGRPADARRKPLRKR